MKDEDRSTAETELAGEPAQLVDLLLHRIAHEDERIDLVGAGFLARVGKHTSNLRRAPDTGHAAHGSMKLPRGGEPAARLAFVEAAIEDELDIKPADRPGRLEHFTLQPARAIPRCLAACGRIEREDQPASPARWLRRLHGLDLTQERLDLRRLARGGQMVLLSSSSAIAHYIGSCGNDAKRLHTAPAALVAMPAVAGRNAEIAP